jgi:ATP-binding cassette subfamily B protein/ATP-binding cassette subfamily C protein
MPYLVFTRMNSSEMTKIIVSDAVNIRIILSNILLLFSDFLIVLLFYGFMVAVQWQVAIITTVVLGGIAFLIATLITRTSRRLGIRRSEGYNQLYRILGKTFGNFKFIRMKNDEGSIEDDFNRITKKLSRSETIFYTLNAMPRGILETIGFSLLIGIVMVVLWRYQSVVTIVPILSMYALGLYRILPSINRIVGNINSIAFHLPSIEAAHDNLRQEVLSEGDEAISFSKEICVDNISFNYVVGNRILHDVTLTIGKGEKVAVTGESGSGKSTLIDLLIGIHKPELGTLRVDGVEITDDNVRSWRSKIGYIPQNIYLFDGTVGENVSLGAPFDQEQVIRVLKTANIWDFLQEKQGIDTPVGEGGVQLSGGQKQRIGIARALYTNPEVLVLDEATSSLDAETEEKIMDEIYRISEDKTLVVIAHRLSSVERCGRRIVLENGWIKNEDMNEEKVDDN